MSRETDHGIPHPDAGTAALAGGVLIDVVDDIVLGSATPKR
jgi:hypothetical protein